jgi:hypothetical protein
MSLISEVYKKLHLLTRYQWDNKIRLGGSADGGYVIADGLDYDLLLAGGIAVNISFEEDFLQRNPNVSKGYGFDGTVETMPNQNTSKLKLVSKNIHSKATDTETDLIEYMADCKDIFLKMDIEGAEFDWILDSEVDFSKFKQMTIEFHPFGNSDKNFGRWFCFLDSLEKLNKTHKLIHVHANNIAGVFDFEYKSSVGNTLVTLPRVPELTFLRNDQFKEHYVKKDVTPIPQPIDIQNFDHIPEVSLFNFPWE